MSHQDDQINTHWIKKYLKCLPKFCSLVKTGYLFLSPVIIMVLLFLLGAYTENRIDKLWKRVMFENQDILDNMGSELTACKATIKKTKEMAHQLSTLEAEVASLKEKVLQVKMDENPPTENPPTNKQTTNKKTTNKKMQKLWKTIFEQYNKGLPFSDELKALASYVRTSKEMSEVIHELTHLAKEPVETLGTLTNNLQDIKSDFMVDQTGKKISHIWYEKVIHSLKNLIVIRKAGDPKPTLKKDLQSDMRTLDTALELLKNNKIKACIEYLKKISTSYPELKSWVDQAIPRERLDFYFKKMQKLMDSMKS